VGLPAVAYKGWTNGGNVNFDGHAPANVWHFIDAGAFFSNVQTWIGVAVGVLLIVAAIQLRMRRSEI
jgi:hypothetical protein